MGFFRKHDPRNAVNQPANKQAGRVSHLTQLAV